jgi:hypothetical protein
MLTLTLPETIMVGNVVLLENLRIFEKATIFVGGGTRRAALAPSDLSRAPSSEALNEASMLTNYLIQKSFVTTIRALARVNELIEKVRQAEAPEAIKSIEENILEFIKEVFSYQRLSQSGRVVESNDEAVLSLFDSVYKIISNSEQKPREEITEALKSHQQKYIQIIVDMVVDRAADLQSFGQGTFVREAEEQLNQLDRDNFKDLVSSYVISMNSSDSGTQLAEVTDVEKHRMLGGIITAIDASVGSYKQKGMELSVLPQATSGSLKGLIEGWRRSKKSMIVQGSVETEMFLIDVRYHINRLQQLVILSGVLDKINAYHQAITAMEAGIEEIFLRNRAESTRLKSEKVAQQAKSEAASEDPYLRVAAIFSETRGSVLAGDSARDQQTGTVMGEVSGIASQSRNYFETRMKTINSTIVGLNKLSTKLRANHPIITAEAGQKNGPKTVEMLEETAQAMAHIRSSLNADVSKLAPR